MTTRFTVDLHFGHANIIGFCGRPFADVASMDARMLAELQARVRPDDDLWVLGDFAIGKATNAQRAEVRAMFEAIPGRKIWWSATTTDRGSGICPGTARPRSRTSSSMAVSYAFATTR